MHLYNNNISKHKSYSAYAINLSSDCMRRFCSISADNLLSSIVLQTLSPKHKFNAARDSYSGVWFWSNLLSICCRSTDILFIKYLIRFNANRVDTNLLATFINLLLIYLYQSTSLLSVYLSQSTLRIFYLWGIVSNIQYFMWIYLQTLLCLHFIQIVNTDIFKPSYV